MLVNAGLTQLYPEAYVRPFKPRAELARLAARAAAYARTSRIKLQRVHRHEHGMVKARAAACRVLPHALRAEAMREDPSLLPLTFLVPRHTPPVEKAPPKKDDAAEGSSAATVSAAAGRSTKLSRKRAKPRAA